MISIKINNIEFLVKKNISILEACKFVGIYIPRFCYHEKLSIAGNCRMCLIDNGIKLVSSCTALVEDNKEIFTDTPAIKKARENIVESLLLNHPLDCPICDQGGECDLQDQAWTVGGQYSRFFFNKRGVEDKDCGPLIKTIMTRCIHCTRCVRFGTEVAGVDYFGTLNRGTSTEIGNYIPKLFDSEMSGNVIDLCPVGALTSKPYAFKARPWELRITESIDLSDSIGSNIYLNFKETEVVRILPKNTIDINENWISDKARFSYDSLKTQRLDTVLEKKDKNFSKLTWQELLKNFQEIIKSKKVTFLVDDDLDLTSINLLKKIQNKNPERLKLRTLTKISDSSNVNSNFFDCSFNKVNKTIDYCFVISSNVRLEAAVLNSRLRSKHINETFNVINLGLKSKNNIPMKTINIGLENILNALEGKSKIISSKFFSGTNPLFIIGASLKQRVNNIETIQEIIKTFAPSAFILNIGEKSNTKGLNLLGNIKTLSKKDINDTEVLCCINLQDNISTRKITKLFTGNIFWFNTHYTSIINTFKNCILVPILSFYESENIFINLEGRPQKTLKGINGPKQAKAFRRFLINIFEDINVSSKSNLFLLEMLKTFKAVSEKTSINFKHSLGSTKYNLTPIKSSVEDFHRTNNFLKNSPIMAECSQEARKNSTNF